MLESQGKVGYFSRLACAALLTAAWILAVPAELTSGPQSDREIQRTMNDFLSALNNLDMDKFLECFAEDATVFYPTASPPQTSPRLLRGRSEMERAFKVVFEQIRTYSGRTSAPYLELQPRDMTIQSFDQFAVVTFHLGNGPVISRRTFVLRKVQSAWKIVHLHASQFSLEAR